MPAAKRRTRLSTRVAKTGVLIDALRDTGADLEVARRRLHGTTGERWDSAKNIDKRSRAMESRCIREHLTAWSLGDA